MSSDWSNVLILAEHLFSLPASNGKVERVFSIINTIKVKNRSLLNNESLDDLLTLTSDLIPLNEFSADPAIDLWWSAATRRPNQKARKCYRRKKRKMNPGSASSTSTDESECVDESAADVDGESEVDSDSSTDHEIDLSEWDALFWET